MAKDTSTRIEAAALKRWVAAILVRRGAPEADADGAAEALVETDMYGVGTHGVSQLPNYLALLDRGLTKARPDIAISRRGAFLNVDADGALGQVAGMRALEAAMALARKEGAAVAAIARTGHLSALGYFTRRAAEAGMIAMMLQNGPPLMALPGATGRAIGNNPFAFAAPVPDGPPIVFDVATSEAAYGKVFQAMAAGESIPEGWALDKEGRPTTDAAAAFAGIMLPSGGFKGIGIAMLVDVLAGSLTGMRPESGGGLYGGFLLVIDPAAGAGRDAYAADMSLWLSRYKAAGPDQRYPGERAMSLHGEALRSGVPVTADTFTKLSAIGEAAGLPFPAA